MGLPTQPIPNSATKPAPYGMLKVSLILLTIAVAWAVIVIASATQLGTDWLKRISGLLLLATIGTGYWAKRMWSEILRIEAEPTFRRKHRSFALKAMIAICAVLLLAAEEGIRVGTHVRHVKKIAALTEQLEALAEKSAPTNAAVCTDRTASNADNDRIHTTVQQVRTSAKRLRIQPTGRGSRFGPGLGRTSASKG